MVGIQLIFLHKSVKGSRDLTNSARLAFESAFEWLKKRLKSVRRKDLAKSNIFGLWGWRSNAHPLKHFWIYLVELAGWFCFRLEDHSSSCPTPGHVKWNVILPSPWRMLPPGPAYMWCKTSFNAAKERYTLRLTRLCPRSITPSVLSVRAKFASRSGPPLKCQVMSGFLILFGFAKMEVNKNCTKIMLVREHRSHKYHHFLTCFIIRVCTRARLNPSSKHRWLALPWQFKYLEEYSKRWKKWMRLILRGSTISNLR